LAFPLAWGIAYGMKRVVVGKSPVRPEGKGTRNHKRKRLCDVVQDVERHVQANGPWQYNLSQIYQAPEVTATVEHMTHGAQAKIAACVYESHVG
jgi:hypothetical protein